MKILKNNDIEQKIDLLVFSNEMECPKLKYQQLLSTLLLGAYLVGHLSVPIFEGIHFLMHLGDKVPIHSFQSHNTQHSHQALANLDQLVSNNPTTDIPVKQSTDNKYKKVVQQFTLNSFLFFRIPLINTANFITKLVSYPTPFPQLTIPPPKG